MPKIVKNGLEYSGTPLEEVTAWPPTGDSVQIEQPLMGNTDISEVGDGTVTGAIAQNTEDITELNNGLTETISFTYSNKTVNLNFIKIGNVLHAQFSKDDSSMTLPTTWTNIGTLTNSKAPAGTMRYMPFITSNGLTGTIRLGSDGAVSIVAHSSSAYWMQSSASTVL